MAYIDCTKIKERNREGLEKSVKQSFFFSILAFCIDITGLFNLVLFVQNASLRNRCKVDNSDTMIPTISMVINLIGIIRMIVAMFLLPIIALLL